MKCGTLEQYLTDAFYRYGKFVARHPWPFLVVPILTSLFLVTGMTVIRQETKSEYIYTPTNGDAKDERTFMQETFTENDVNYFSSSRKTSLDGILQIILHSRNQLSVLNHDDVQEIFYVDSFVKNFSVMVEKNSFRYNDLCSKWNGSCEINPLLEVLENAINNNNNVSLSTITYPVANGFYFIGGLLGGVEISTNGIITDAKAVQLIYHLRHISSCDATHADAWLESITNYFVEDNLNLQYLEMSFITSLSLDTELTRVTDDITRSFSTLYVAVVISLVAFVIMTSLMADCVKSKPVVSLCGLISACLAIASTFGVLPGWNIPYTSTVAGMPFLIIGIGVDDMFVILSAWRHTSPKLSVEERMGQTMKASAVSITLTSITDALAFSVGAITPIRAVIYFCAYTGIAIIFCYIYVITFFASCLCFSGMREKQNRHSVLCCIKTKDNETEKNNMNCFYKLCCTGGEHGEKEKPGGDNIDRLQPFLTKFMRKYFSHFILLSITKICILLSYTAYIGFGIYGCIILEEGLDNKHLAYDDSYVAPFYENQRRYFSPSYGPRVMVAVKGNLNYSSKSIQNEIQHLLSQFENNLLFDGDHNLTESWLQQYVNYLKQTNQEPTSLNEFLRIFKENFTKISSYSHFALDVSFETSSNSIIATRYFVQSIGVHSSIQEKELLLKSRDIAKQSSLDVEVFHPVFIHYDQYPIILRTTLQNMSIAVIVVAFVTFAFIPNIGVVLWICFSLISICFGVVGFMALWNVSLNAISMVFIIMCIGFSVDFSAHMVYHIARSTSTIFSKRIQEAMSHIGVPILQGAISSILAIVALGFSESQIFRSFFKLMVLVMVFGIYHSIFVLPILLSIQHNISFLIRRKVIDNCEDKKPKNLSSSCSSIPTISSYDEKDSNLRGTIIHVSSKTSMGSISGTSLFSQFEPVTLLEESTTIIE